MEKKIYGLLGEHLTHSYSPAIHAALGDYEYRIFEYSPVLHASHHFNMFYHVIKSFSFFPNCHKSLISLI